MKHLNKIKTKTMLIPTYYYLLLYTNNCIKLESFPKISLSFTVDRKMVN